jgi:hypothetical protein
MFRQISNVEILIMTTAESTFSTEAPKDNPPCLCKDSTPNKEVPEVTPSPDLSKDSNPVNEEPKVVPPCLPKETDISVTFPFPISIGSTGSLFSPCQPVVDGLGQVTFAELMGNGAFENGIMITLFIGGEVSGCFQMFFLNEHVTTECGNVKHLICPVSILWRRDYYCNDPFVELIGNA